MALLPAVVPEIPESRAEVVPARLARKVAPLFGVQWPESPLGPATWVIDFTRVTLSEIARGAPLPTRSQASAFADRSRDGWALVDRVAVTARSAALPNEIANATLNRYGPDTRAAVILAAVNRLLDPLRVALDETIPLLVDEAGEPLPPGLRLAGWAGVLVEVFRSQPALVAAGVRARATQRSMAPSWDVPLAPSAADEPLTRCEIGAPLTAGTPVVPRDLDIADATLPRLDVLGPLATNPVARDELHEAVIGLLLRRILDVGSLRDASHLWISARGPGQLAVEALLTPTSIVDRFVRVALRTADVTARGLDDGGTLPAVPDPTRFAELPILSRRTATIALLGVLRQVLASPPARERARAAVLDRLERLRCLVGQTLPDDDPVRAVAVCRIDLTRLQMLRHNATTDLRDALDRLTRSTRRCQDLFDTGVLDRGAAAEIVSASNVEVNAVRTTNAAAAARLDGGPGGALPDADLLDEQLRARWQHWLRMVEVEPEMLTGARPVVDLLGYHLHNYAAFLASHAGSEDDLLAAITLFQDVVLPARERFLTRTGIFDPLRTSLQMGTVATTALAESAAARGDTGHAREWAGLGHRWIARALADESTRAMCRESTERSCRFALRAAPALTLAVELGVAEANVAGPAPGDAAAGDAEARGTAPPPDSAANSLDLAAELVTVARRWEASVVTSAEQHIRHQEIETWSRRVERLRAR
ncbi:hypothetical protein [Frankia sp. QA3]|uniref:hypothetical protein n=1 Tax=Frankia sp. QA3 TaxID=710111 RepID=UPI000269C6EC|nr:hypothetical protein [Frankia sp. QA3]EIV93608.1 hypothetical protein FraQA3DRAFT_3319 [Frankia sp. QA3]